MLFNIEIDSVGSASLTWDELFEENVDMRCPILSAAVRSNLTSIRLRLNSSTSGYTFLARLFFLFFIFLALPSLSLSSSSSLALSSS
jgi:hypothetical protein